MTEKMLSKKSDGLGWMIFNNPEKRNAVSLDMWLAATRIMQDFAADDEVRVIVIAGAGDKSFVAGADISKFDDERAEADAVARYNDATEGAYQAVLTSPKPTIAMIQGYCIGGGANLAVCADLRIASERARFAIPAARLGLGYDYPRVRRVMSLVGPSFAKEIFFTARQFTADEALGMGLVNRVVPHDELERLTVETAGTIAANAPLTMKAIKEAVHEALADEAQRDLDRIERLVQDCFESEDYEEGRRAFAEKRKPAFKGR
jgi:enoyl-CoA hydratase